MGCSSSFLSDAGSPLLVDDGFLHFHWVLGRTRAETLQAVAGLLGQPGGKSWRDAVVYNHVVLFTAIPEQGVFWSPYYRIDFHVVSPPPGLSKPAAYSLDVNHDYHQRALDLSGDFMRRYPDYFPNREALASYDLPY